MLVRVSGGDGPDVLRCGEYAASTEEPRAPALREAWIRSSRKLRPDQAVSRNGFSGLILGWRSARLLAGRSRGDICERSDTDDFDLDENYLPE